MVPIDPDKDNFVRGGKRYEAGAAVTGRLRGRGKGRGTVYAAMSRKAFRFEKFVGDHWDYRALAPSRLSNNPSRSSTSWCAGWLSDFDYDILS